MLFCATTDIAYLMNLGNPHKRDDNFDMSSDKCKL